MSTWAADLANHLEERAAALESADGLPDMNRVADFLIWVDRVLSKASLVGFHEQAMAVEGLFRTLCMNAVVTDLGGPDYRAAIVRVEDTQELARVFEMGLAADFDNAEETRDLGATSRRLCQAYVEAVHAIGILP